MKSLYVMLPLLLLSIATSSIAINANAATIENSALSATEQRLDDPIPAPIQKGSIQLRLKQIADGLTAPNWVFPSRALPSICMSVIRITKYGALILPIAQKSFS